MNASATIDGITYTAQPDTNGCDGCCAINDPLHLCTELQTSQNSRNYCAEQDVIWIKQEPATENTRGLSSTLPQPAVVEGQSRFQLYGQVLNAWTAAGNSPTQLQALSLQDFLEFCYTNRINLEITNAKQD